MVTVSPPVSPSVVARILMIQKLSVTAGTLVSTSRATSRSFIRSPFVAKTEEAPERLGGSDAPIIRHSMASVVIRLPFGPVLDDFAGPVVNADFLDIPALQ